MFKNKSKSGKNNICGEKIYSLRKEQTSKMSQRILADKLQLKGIDLDKNAIQRIESGERFVTDIEIKALAEIFNTSVDDLLKWNSHIPQKTGDLHGKYPQIEDDVSYDKRQKRLISRFCLLSR